MGHRECKKVVPNNVDFCSLDLGSTLCRPNWTNCVGCLWCQLRRFDQSRKAFLLVSAAANSSQSHFEAEFDSLWSPKCFLWEIAPWNRSFAFRASSNNAPLDCFLLISFYSSRTSKGPYNQPWVWPACKPGQATHGSVFYSGDFPSGLVFIPKVPPIDIALAFRKPKTGDSSHAFLTFSHFRST